MNKPTRDLLQQEVEKRLRASERENVEELIAFLHGNGYYTANCHRHHHFTGGTSQHGMEALLYALEHNQQQIPEASLTIVCLLHDLCNIPGFPQYGGHGNRSVRLITEAAHFALTEDERLAILHHMHHPARDRHRFGEDHEKVTHSALWKLLREADHHSAENAMGSDELSRGMRGEKLYWGKWTKKEIIRMSIINP